VAIANKKVPQFLADLSPETLNRDECRTPDALERRKPNAGFCDSAATPWLPITPTYKTINVATQESDSNSLWQTYRQLLLLRKNIGALHSGSFKLSVKHYNNQILAYERFDSQTTYLILLNMSKKVKNIPSLGGRTIFTTHSNAPVQQLQPYEGRVVKLNP
jgi:glycosidase